MSKIDIWVYGHWQGMPAPVCMGILSAHAAKGRKAFSFEYDQTWLQSRRPILLDPDIGWFSGPQFPSGKENFGVFLDSMPDRWGRTLLKRRAAQIAKEANRAMPTLHDVDFLLGVHDESRMGALRFKLDPDGPFLDNATMTSVPPWSSLRELQQAAQAVESEGEHKSLDKWLAILLAPGSSLGGARPKANVRGEHSHPWIAKFPSRHDSHNAGAWEYLLHRLARNAGVTMSECKMLKIGAGGHTFLTKRFDRVHGERIHFASAMTMTGNSEETLRDHVASYLDLAEFIRFSGASVQADLHQLWRRIVFNIAVSNTDDHLRNHGFLLLDEGWRLAPAYDLNPNMEKDGLALNIDMENNTLDFDLALHVGEYFQLTNQAMQEILNEVKNAVRGWRSIADAIGIPKQEQGRLEPAFRV